MTIIDQTAEVPEIPAHVLDKASRKAGWNAKQSKHRDPYGDTQKGSKRPLRKGGSHQRWLDRDEDSDGE